MFSNLESNITDIGHSDFKKKVLYIIATKDSCLEKLILQQNIVRDQLNTYIALGSKAEFSIPPHVVLFHRTIDPDMFDSIPKIKEFDIPVKAYYDDALPVLYMDKFHLWSKLNNVDELIVATPELKEFFSQFLPKDKIIFKRYWVEKSIIDKLQPIKISHNPDSIDIVIAQSHCLGIHQLRELFQKISQSNLKEKFENVNFIIISTEIAYIRSLLLEFTEDINIFSLDYCPLHVLYSVVKGSSILCAPASYGDLEFVPEQYREMWLNAKTCLKYLIAMACKTVFVGTKKFIEYRKHVKHEQTGMLFDTTDELLEILLYLIENEDKRIELVNNAYKELPEWDEKNCITLYRKIMDIKNGKKNEEKGKDSED